MIVLLRIGFVFFEIFRAFKYGAFLLGFITWYGLMKLFISNEKRVAKLNRYLFQGRDHFYKESFSLKTLLNARELRKKTGFHWYIDSLHLSREKVVQEHLPPADVIVDVGGASRIFREGALYKMGYPYHAKLLTIIDLPYEDKPEHYKGVKVPDAIVDSKFADKIQYVHASMTDLSAVKSGSVDLVYSGQSIEHITEEDSFTLYEEVNRVLKPGGCFCLDTPNEPVVRLSHPNNLIDPDHKLEYTPAQLISNIEKFNFELNEKLGIVPVPLSIKYKTFFREEIWKNIYRLYDDPNLGYLFFLKFRKK